MTQRIGVSVSSYLLAGLLALASALAVGDPRPAWLGTPLLLVAALAALTRSQGEVTIRMSGIPDTVVEGEVLPVTIEIGATSLPRSVLLLGLPSGFVVAGVEGGRHHEGRGVTLAPIKGGHTVAVELGCVRWGRWRISPPRLRVADRLGGYESVYSAGTEVTVTVLPAPVRTGRLINPRDTDLHSGDLVSGLRGRGLEFADIRPYRPGDDTRALNWRVSNRHGDLWVNDRNPERNGDVMVLVDAAPQFGLHTDLLVDRAVRLAEALLAGHARRRHRIGLISVDGMCRWIPPGMGEMHRRRLLHQLVTMVPGELRIEAIERAIHRAARPPVLLLAITPLLDGELAGILHRLKLQGVDVVVVELDAADHLPPPQGELSSLGRRLWYLERERIRDKLTGSGIPVGMWRQEDPPEVPLNTIEEWRRAWRRVRV